MKASVIKLLILICCGFITEVLGLNSVSCRSVEPAVFSILAKKNSETIQWNIGSEKGVVILATEKKACNIVLELNENYYANEEFGKGSRIGDAYVVYKGNGNSTTVKGLKTKSKYYFTVYEISPEGLYFSNIDNFVNGEKNSITDKQAPTAPSAVVVCACPPIAGVTCSITGTTNSGTSTASAGGCPHVGYCDPGSSNPWTNSVGVGNIQWLFSAPVSNATLRMNSVNTNDYGTISAAGGSGGTISLSGVICMGVAGLVVGPLSVAGYGGVYFTVNSTGSYTQVTLSNTGMSSGFVAACPTSITTVLPIELVSLSGKCNGSGINLQWQTLTETNNSYFTIERSYNTENWDVIGRLAGAGTSTSIRKYSFTDDAPVNALAYYRLKQTDFDKEFKYSELITVENCKGKEEVSIYPNPASSEVFIESSGETKLEIFNILGEISSTQALTIGKNKIDLSTFSNGTYFFKLSNSNSVLKFSKVIVNN